MTGPGREVAPSKPELVVTLPGRTPEALKQELAIAQAAGADLVEIRLDRMRRRDIPRLEMLHQIPLSHEWVPTIATIRSKAEGGEGPDDLETRRKIFEEAMDSLPFTWVDLEVARDRTLAAEFSRSFGRLVSVISSAHLPPDTGTDAVQRALRETVGCGKIGKVVLPAGISRTLHEFLPLCERIRGSKYVLHTTGPSASLLRLLSLRLGMALVYCGLPDGHTRVDSGQPPVDRMRGLLDANVPAGWYGVLGHPIGHTRSPTLHHALLERTGLAGIYVSLDAESPEEFRAVVPELFSLGFRGFNVTRPYKADAFGLATQRDENAVVTRVANTLLRVAGGEIEASNTDLPALVEILGELVRDGTWKDLRLLVVGAGGLARAAVAAGVEVGATVFVLSRREEETLRLISDFPSEHVYPITSQALRPFPVVVHATPAGQEDGSVLSVPIGGALGPGSVVLDGVYLPATDELRALAEAKKARYVDGWALLVRQATLSFKTFTGVEVPPETREEFLENRPTRGGLYR